MYKEKKIQTIIMLIIVFNPDEEHSLIPANNINYDNENITLL